MSASAPAQDGEAAAGTAATMKRSERFWFDDGNVILQAESTQFRLHRSVLSIHSEVMRDCFSMPQPSDGPALDGCPVVHVSDLAKDIENLCSLLYAVYRLDYSNISVSYLETLLRFGRKYEIAFFLPPAQAYLRNLFPTGLRKRDTTRNTITAIMQSNRRFLFDIINLASECEFTTILPAACLNLCRLHSLDEILRGVIPFALPPGTRPLVVLRRDALIQCIMCRTHLLNQGVEILIEYVSPLEHEAKYAYEMTKDLVNCLDKPRCSRGYARTLRRIIGRGHDEDLLDYPPNVQDYISGYDRDICHRCATVFADLYTRMRHRSIWGILPQFFGLPRWEEEDLLN